MTASVILAASVAASRVSFSGSVAVTSVTLSDLSSQNFFGGLPLFRVFPCAVSIVSVAIVSVDSPLCVSPVSVAFLSTLVIVAGLPLLFLLFGFEAEYSGYAFGRKALSLFAAR